MNFPRTEGDVLILANEMASGLGAQAAVYPAPPVAPLALTDLVTTLNDARGRSCRR